MKGVSDFFGGVQSRLLKGSLPSGQVKKGYSKKEYRVMIYNTSKLQDSKVVKEIQIALSGIGKLPVNRKIKKRTWELEKVFGYSKVELCNMIYT